MNITLENQTERIVSYEQYDQQISDFVETLTELFVFISKRLIFCSNDGIHFDLKYEIRNGQIIPIENIISIGEYEFQNCYNIISVVLSSSITSIGEGAFVNCHNIAIVFSEENYLPSSLIFIGNSAFEHCGNLTSIVLPSSITSIGDHAFYNCRNLTSITFPSSITSIGDSAFDGCSALEFMEIECDCYALVYFQQSYPNVKIEYTGCGLK